MAQDSDSARLVEVTCRLDAILLLARPGGLTDLSTTDSLHAVVGLARWARLHAAVLAEHTKAA